MKKEPTNQAEIRHPSCQCDICLERASIKAGEAGKANTAPTPTETILDDPDATAGHAVGGGADATTVAISKTGECDPDPTPEVGAMVPNICREKESFYPPAEQGRTKVPVNLHAKPFFVTTPAISVQLPITESPLPITTP